jgi:hypothetical protein
MKQHTPVSGYHPAKNLAYVAWTLATQQVLQEASQSFLVAGFLQPIYQLRGVVKVCLELSVRVWETCKLHLHTGFCNCRRDYHSTIIRPHQKTLSDFFVFVARDLDKV